MSMTEMGAMKVGIIPFRLRNSTELPALQVSEIPPRSRFYDLVPCELGTMYQESLTSYLNRLGWRHRVSPRDLVAQELVPFFGNEYLQHQLGTCCRGGWFMSVNGNGSLALEWSTLLEQLTLRSDLHLLTLHWWLGDLSSRGHLRAVPAWCPSCYSEWKEQGLSVYQPLLWMFRVVTTCTKHKRKLEECCLHCGKRQSVITLKIRPGHCTQCGAWLGIKLDNDSNQSADHETILWQEWVAYSLEELRVASATAGPLSWTSFFTSIAVCLKERGICSKLTNLTGMERARFYGWTNDTPEYIPMLETILRFCYSCGVTPLEVMTNHHSLLYSLQNETSSRNSQYHRFALQRVDRDQCLALINAVIEGREQLIGLTQIAKRLGHSEATLQRHFPQECTVITKQAKEYRKQRKKQRVMQMCEEVRQATITLHAQGIFPAVDKVRNLLSDPGVIRNPVARATWHAACRELGLEH
jgi:TniQ